MIPVILKVEKDPIGFQQLPVLKRFFATFKITMRIFRTFYTSRKR